MPEVRYTHFRPGYLCGFYFRLNARGDGVTDSLYAPDQQRMAVTEIIDPFRTMSLSWKAERPGNWIFTALHGPASPTSRQATGAAGCG